MDLNILRVENVKQRLITSWINMSSQCSGSIIVLCFVSQEAVELVSERGGELEVDVFSSHWKGLLQTAASETKEVRESPKHQNHMNYIIGLLFHLSECPVLLQQLQDEEFPTQSWFQPKSTKTINSAFFRLKSGVFIFSLSTRKDQNQHVSLSKTAVH